MHTAARLKAALKVVLIVDDSPAVRVQVRELFLSAGFKSCSEAENGHAALAIAQDCKPHIIILDVSMPVMNGLVAAPKLKALLPATFIILFTLHAHDIRETDLTSLGISAIFSKNDPLDHLVHKAHELMAG